MNSAAGLLRVLSARGVKLALDDHDNLLIRGSKNELSADLIASIKELKANIVSLLQADKQHSSTRRIPRAPRDAPLAVSCAQKRIWLLDQIDGSSAHYNIFGAFQLSGALDLKSFESAFSAIVERHESLRTCFAAGEGGEPTQVVRPAEEFAIGFVDLSKLTDLERHRVVAQQLTDESGREFHLDADLMLRVRLLRIDDAEHIVTVTMHHIAGDGWSMAILMKEFAALYGAFLQGRDNPLPPLTLQYADYAHWQRTWLQGEVLEKLLGYWERQLAGIPVLHGLPTDRPRPPIQSHAGSVHARLVDAATRDALKALCRKHQATLFMGLHAAFSVLLARHSGETAIVVGSPIANREQVELADLIGFFANTLVLRSDLSCSLSFTEVLQQSRAVLLEAYVHQQVPFEQIVERLRPQRSLSHTPLFQIALVLQHDGDHTLKLQGLTLKPLDRHGSVAKFDLTLVATQSAAGLSLLWEYSTALFDLETIARLADHFDVLLRSLVQRPNEDVFKVDMISRAEREALLARSNLNAAQYPADKCVYQYFEEQVRSAPDAIAVIYEDQQLTYRELNARANQLARYLRSQRRVQLDDLVGICIERSLDMVVAILGVLKAGGAYVPLDPAYPAARLKYIIADAGLIAVITLTHLQENIPIERARLICLDDAQTHAVLDQQSSNDPHELGLKPSNLAYVIYTSGSTGNSKGVMVEHRNVTRLMHATKEHFAFGRQDVWTLFHSYAFDFSVWELWGALVYGGTLVVVPLWVARAPSELCQLLVRRGVTVLNQTPSAFISLLQEESLHELPLRLRYVIFGGEALNLAALQPWVEAHGERPQLINMYGITETTVHVTYLRVTKEMVDAATGGSPIGAPLSDLQLLILDSRQSLAPLGVAGEIYVGGAGVARGYLNRPDLDDARFVTLPEFGDERFYRSGDLARHLPASGIEYLGRADHQVKIRGFRIELGEIEAVLASQKGVREALVLTREDARDEKRLIAYYSASDPKPDRNELRQALSARLPNYMVPQHFIAVDAFPLTSNGKIDRKRLPAPDAARPAMEHVAPRTTLESLLCEVWQEALDLDGIGVNDNFFAIGGDSMRVVKLVRRAAGRGVFLRVKDVFAHQTVAELSRFVTESPSAASGPDEPAPLHLLARFDDATYVDEHVEDCYPATQMQRLMWEMHCDPSLGSGVYQPQVLFEFDNLELSPSTLNQALVYLVNKHPTLRTRFTRTADGELLQEVYRRLEVGLPVLDLTTSREDEQERRVGEIIRADTCRRFELGQPCIRFRLLEFADRKWALLITSHHAIEDGWGFTEFTNELLSAYRILDGGDCLQAPVSRANVMKEHVALEMEARQSTAHRQAWEELLSGYQPMPALSPRAGAAAHAQEEPSVALGLAARAAVIELDLAESLIEQLSARARMSGASMKVVFLLAYQRALAKMLNASIVTVDVVSSGRSARISDPFGAMGLFWSFLPVLSNGMVEDSSALAALSAALNKTDAHALYPRDCIVRNLAEGNEPLTYVAFNFVNFHNRKNATQSGWTLKCRYSADRFHHPVKLAIAKQGARSFSARLEYDRRFFGAEQMVNLARSSEHELRKLAEACRK